MERKQIPTPLQVQILMQAGLAVCSLIAGIAFLILFTGIVAFPFLLLAILASVNGWRVYHVAAHGHYLTLSSIVLKVERTAFLRRPKAVLVEAEGKALRVMLRSRLSAPKEGSCITFYVQDSTPIYEWKGLHLLGSYLALADKSFGSAQ